MRYLIVFVFLWLSQAAFSQAITENQTVSGVITNDNTKLPISNVNIINLNKVIGTVSDAKGRFEINVSVSDTLLLSYIGFQSLKIRVTNDWIKNKTTQIQMTEKAIALEEIIIQPYYLTGYLEVDSKLIPSPNNYRYSISGLSQGYEAGEYSPGAFGNILGSMFNPADALYNFFGKKGNELKRLKKIKKDETVRNLLESKFDRETLATLLGIDKKEIAEILDRCNYSEAFIKTANDLQIMDAISGCYEEYKVLKKK
ncbi:carboxypeptidase-like regulatory domain-containing protein [Flavobacterium sp. CYK-4]|uniref:carboxypeptidase-like regulatory domain-containing protein n=1 Tax=Flavobacterium lotistagni TaxID=2709660 RepID=UPI00140DA054|nr:carboxypeptidase-like regulatory domain-containing protein [Flavobacterium lotistagni]NHM07177.1 carboxypeptidase-like regulatory domain-containing protein [Flavobacterium lotistagni]